MQYLLAFFTALVISVALIPVMIRVAPRLGLVDRPDARKVHRTPIPRVGGVGIAIGVLVPLILWMPLDPELASYLFGAFVLLLFGLWDDAKQLGPRVKFVGQLLAVLPVVYLADIHIDQLPLFEPGAVPDWFTKPFTVFALVGVINAVNTSDGLDGLAGGLSMLSLAAIAFLGHNAGGWMIVAIAAATLGGVLGFLRYNTHPANVFMGDGGSQFLGFTLGFLIVYLTQNTNLALSPAVPLLLLGLPIADLLSVMAQRISRGESCFQADKTHFHHRLLDVGFDHYEAVVAIYSIQTLLVVAGVVLRYESDALILGLYGITWALLFGLLFLARISRWRPRHSGRPSRLTAFVLAARRHPVITTAPTLVVIIALPALLVLVSVVTDRVPRDVAITSSLLAIILLLYLALSAARSTVIPRAIAYVTSAFVVYLETRYAIEHAGWLDMAEVGYFAVLAFAIALAVRFGAKREFHATPMDFLVVIVVLALGLLAHNNFLPGHLGQMTVKLVILFYGCELILSNVRTPWNPLNMSALTALGILGVRGLL